MMMFSGIALCAVGLWFGQKAVNPAPWIACSLTGSALVLAGLAQAFLG